MPGLLTPQALDRLPHRRDQTPASCRLTSDDRRPRGGRRRRADVDGGGRRGGEGPLVPAPGSVRAVIDTNILRRFDLIGRTYWEVTRTHEDGRWNFLTNS